MVQNAGRLLKKGQKRARVKLKNTAKTLLLMPFSR